MLRTFSYACTVLYRRFTHYTSNRLHQLGLSFGTLFFLIYVGKHPGCTQSELTTDLRMDWGHSQRTVLKLVESGFLNREKDGRAYRLTLSDKGRQAFEASHQVFFDWDEEALSNLTPEERTQLMALLFKAMGRGPLPDLPE
ncbi:bilirubin utilization transcriptional regulator BilQ [Subdoligranulum variabile]|uniref:bilirubin utilization transcriptional regulator BilQ n=1 Tax=Subdoligranulum variabile TaxID=214851 RepID=UPI0026ECF45B|nr:bilirubin utilization transcriptional regulator BilQ [Subdoligranulum variabile]MCI6519903.1 MarR family winged helix-turn-helix transcriptional regulator [bacterium]